MKYSANSVWENKDSYDVAVIGAGHAGCEAALAAAKTGDEDRSSLQSAWKALP